VSLVRTSIQIRFPVREGPKVGWRMEDAWLDR